MSISHSSSDDSMEEDLNLVLENSTSEDDYAGDGHKRFGEGYDGKAKADGETEEEGNVRCS